MSPEDDQLEIEFPEYDPTEEDLLDLERELYDQGDEHYDLADYFFGDD